ncbi:site-specific integrase [Enterocloster citroniae]
MAKPKKKNQLPSGQFRVQVYDYTDDDGKKHYKSFTAASKKLAQLAAAEWKANKDKPTPMVNDLTINEAANRYMSVKKGVLSPSTLRGYQGIVKNYLSGKLGGIRLLELDNTDIQIWVSDLAVKVSPKTVRNAYGLLSVTLEMFAPDFRVKVTLPAKKKAELYCPSDDDVRKLLNHIKGTELEIAVLLAAFGPLRRGEICALTNTDVHGNTIEVSRSMVKGADREWYIKQPKTYGSYRSVEFPDFVIDKIKNINGPLVKSNPDYITHRFGRVLKTIDIPHFRFHDLRHYSASIMHAIGIPDQYILQRGGWTSDNVMKTVYRNVIDLESVKQNRKINEHFRKLKSV